MIGSNCTITVKRQETVNGKTVYGATPILEDVAAYKEQVQPELSPIFNEDSVFESWRIFVDEVVDIQAKDLIIDNDGNEYKVDGRIQYGNPEIPDHTEVIVNKISEK